MGSVSNPRKKMAMQCNGFECVCVTGRESLKRTTMAMLRLRDLNVLSSLLSSIRMYNT